MVKEGQTFKGGADVAILSDNIERFIKNMLTDEANIYVLKRSEIAEQFGCAPSQINYVLQTRFTPERGYIVESKRGGGGCIRVIRMRADHRRIVDALVLEKYRGNGITEQQARSIITGLLEAGIATQREADIMVSAVSDRALNGNTFNRDRLRQDIMQGMTAALLKGDR